MGARAGIYVLFSFPCLLIPQVYGENQVDADLLECALRFSAEARMSPLWNRVGPYLMEGRLFLFRPSVAALEPRLYFEPESGAVRFALRAGRARFPGLTLDDFQLEARIRRRFEEGAVDTVPGEYLGLREVSVLPRLTRAAVASITREMLPSPGIRSWKEMRRYWKNMYGFRLQRGEDEDERPPFYVNVVFGFQGKK